MSAPPLFSPLAFAGGERIAFGCPGGSATLDSASCSRKPAASAKSKARQSLRSMHCSTPPTNVRFRWFVSARLFGTAVRVAVTAAVLFQLLLRGIALPEPAVAGGTNGRPAPHVHLTGHPHHHHDHHRHHHGRRHGQADHRATHHHGEHAADERGPTEHGQGCDRLAADEEGGSHPPRATCPADHDSDAIYLDASLVITPAAEWILPSADDAPISWAQLPAAARSDTGCCRQHTSAQGGPPPDFRGRFPHRLQV